jgi:hypothetical protein
MDERDTARVAELLDWLAEAVSQRLQSRPSQDKSGQTAPTAASPARAAGDAAPATPCAVTGQAAVVTSGKVAGAVGPVLSAQVPNREKPEEQGGATGDEWRSELAEPANGAPGHTAPLIGRLALGLLIAVILINIPWLPHGAALARIIPSSASLVIRNGLLVKESDKPEIYVYEDGQFRWVTDLDAFQWYGFQWKNVHEVEPGFLATYPIGSPLAVVAKCEDSPHIYQIRSGVKYWIVDIPAFVAAGYEWSDIRFMECAELRALPTGDSVPPGHTPIPEP